MGKFNWINMFLLYNIFFNMFFGLLFYRHGFAKEHYSPDIVVPGFWKDENNKELCLALYRNDQVERGYCDHVLLQNVNWMECLLMCTGQFSTRDKCRAINTIAYNPSGMAFWKGDCLLEIEKENGEKKCDPEDIFNHLVESESDHRKYFLWVQVNCDYVPPTSSTSTTTTSHFEQCWCDYVG